MASVLTEPLICVKHDHECKHGCAQEILHRRLWGAFPPFPFKPAVEKWTRAHGFRSR